MESKQFIKIDTDILKKSPFQWIIGWHIFIPIILGLFVLAFINGYIPPVKVYDYSVPYLESLSLFLGFLSLIVFVLFVIRQIKFNSFRIHHHLPYSRAIITFFSFWLIALLLVIIPTLSYEAYCFKVKNHISSITDDFNNDVETLEIGLPFFYYESSYRNDKKRNDIDFIDDENIVVNRNYQFTYYNIFEVGAHYTKQEAIIAIENFVQVAKKYEMQLIDYDPYSIFEKRKDAIYQNGYSLLVHEKDNAFNAYSMMFSNYEKNLKYNLEDNELLLFFIIFSSIISFLLWIFISVHKADFGFAVLYGALISLFVGILSAVFGSISDNDFIYRLIPYMSFVIIFILAFTLKNSTLSRVLKILSQIIIPMMVKLINMKIILHWCF